MWDTYRAPLQVTNPMPRLDVIFRLPQNLTHHLPAVQLPVGAPKLLKPRDFLRVHRSLDQHGDGLIRPCDVRAMLKRLGLHLSVGDY